MPNLATPDLEQFVDDAMESGDTLTAGAASNDGTQKQVDPNEGLRSEVTRLSQVVEKAITPRETQKEPTQAELAQKFGVWEPSTEYMRKFLRLPKDMPDEEVNKVIADHMPVMGEMVRGIVGMAIKSTMHLLRENDLKKFREEFEPVREHVASERTQKIVGRFYSAFPALDEKLDSGDRRYAKAVAKAESDLSGKDFPNEGEFFKALAESAAKLIQDIDPTFQLGAVKPKPIAGTTPRLPRTGAGGTGGAGREAGAAKPGKTDDDSGSLDWA